ncbi:MAG: hypothetical protein FI729_03700 [SAR202 cluster bacterium]|nr:hypothetical protein [SAR202 cluster bacterium]|tara:strand:- start:2207 stop:2857 length:651 start_codon:yes stop_codon:yes gene_type:complete
MSDLDSILIPGKSGSIEAVMKQPATGDNINWVIICHPHPLMGGDLTNPIVRVIADHLFEKSISTLALNFRGVGLSSGSYDNGIGELEDALSVIDYLKTSQGISNGKIGIAGYSFGARIALETTSYYNIAAFLVGLTKFDTEIHKSIKPSTELSVVIGEHDNRFDSETFDYISSKLSTKPEINVIRDTDHFFSGKESLVGSFASNFFTNSFRHRNSL